MKRQAIAASLVALVSAGLAGLGITSALGQSDYEEPEYTVLESETDYQLRAYEGWVEARVTVTSSYDDSVQQGFRILANYIFGGNRSRESIAMTTPVATVPSESIDMTAPVSTSGAGRLWTVSFMMPEKWTLQTLPIPDDTRIELVEVPPSLCGVRTFSGRASKRRADVELQALQDRISGAGLEVVGPPSVAQFDPPWILGPWRRNEVRIPVRTINRQDG